MYSLDNRRNRFKSFCSKLSDFFRRHSRQPDQSKFAISKPQLVYRPNAPCSPCNKVLAPPPKDEVHTCRMAVECRQYIPPQSTTVSGPICQKVSKGNDCVADLVVRRVYVVKYISSETAHRNSCEKMQLQTHRDWHQKT